MSPGRTLLITSGGTREPIDEVRYIGNASTGALGSTFAEEALRRGYRVTLLSGQGAIEPPAHECLRLLRFTSAADLRDRLHTLAQAQETFAAIVHAAAVADYTPDRVAGKIASERDRLVLELKRVPKIVDQLKDWFPAAKLVKFKLEVGKSAAELIAIGAASGRQSRADLVVVNDQRQIEGGRHRAWVLAPGRVIEVLGKPAIARAVLDELAVLDGWKRSEP